MRSSAVRDCLRVLRHYGVDPSRPHAIDIGGTEKVYLEGAIKPNPLLEANAGLKFLDGGFNIAACSTRAHQVADFLDRNTVAGLRGSFDLAFCFDTLEHVSDPFRFCGHLLEILKPGGHVYIATVFQWPYHPSPEDYFRFSPEGLRECFRQGVGLSAESCVVLWCDWESDRRAVALLARKGPDLAPQPVRPLVLPPMEQAPANSGSNGFCVRLARLIHNS